MHQLTGSLTARRATLTGGAIRAATPRHPPRPGPGRLNILSSSFRRVGIYMFLAATGVVWTIPDFSSSQGRRAGGRDVWLGCWHHVNRSYRHSLLSAHQAVEISTRDTNARAWPR